MIPDRYGMAAEVHGRSARHSQHAEDTTKSPSHQGVTPAKHGKAERSDSEKREGPGGQAGANADRRQPATALRRDGNPLDLNARPVPPCRDDARPPTPHRRGPRRAPRWRRRSAPTLCGRLRRRAAGQRRPVHGRRNGDGGRARPLRRELPARSAQPEVAVRGVHAGAAAGGGAWYEVLSLSDEAGGAA